MAVKDIWKMEVHPAAAIFPMLPEDELKEMAEDIKINGLRQPIVIQNGILIDGRNRREACKIVGVEPKTIELNGDDPKAYILSANVNRRHMTKGQLAMAVAKIYPEPNNAGRGDKKNPKLNLTFSAQYVSQARTVLRCLPEKADLVLAGVIALNNAYDEAIIERDRNELAPSRKEKLQKIAPDLADLVDEARMSLDEACHMADQRLAEEKNKRHGTWFRLKEILEQMQFFDSDRHNYIVELFRDFPDEAPIKSKDFRSRLETWVENLNKIKRSLS